MNSITNPLRLAVGSHEAGSGRGCAMNVVSWENGDTEITDLPACADPLLARIVQYVNDTICTHRDGELLCPGCSVKVLDLAHRTVGTALDMPDADRARVYVRLALDEAESVARDDDDEEVTEARRVTGAWLDGEATGGEVRAAAFTAVGRAIDAATTAAATAATAANEVAANNAAATAARAVAHAASIAGDRLARAHKLIDRFEALTGVRAEAVPAERTEAAIAQMVQTA